VARLRSSSGEVEKDARRWKKVESGESPAFIRKNLCGDPPSLKAMAGRNAGKTGKGGKRDA